jgi:predicted methyltransferase
MVKFFEPAVPHERSKVIIAKIERVMTDFAANHRMPLKQVHAKAMATGLYWSVMKFIEMTLLQEQEDKEAEAYQRGFEKGLLEGIGKGRAKPCKVCNGRGQKTLYLDGRFHSWTQCDHCNGIGVTL